MSGELASAIPILGSTLSLAKALIEERDAQKAAAIKVDLTKRIGESQALLLDALSTALEQTTTINDLRNRVQEMEVERQEKNRYVLAKLGSLGQFFAYKLRPAAELDERAAEPEHFVCQPCLDIRGDKSVLRLTATHAICNACQITVPIEPSPPAPPNPRRTIDGGFKRGDW